MRHLPPPVDCATIPEYFSPSQLANGEKCLLRAVLGSSAAGVPVLNSHPAAELGRVFHRLLELAARGETPRGGSIQHDVRRCLDELLADTRTRLEKEPLTAAYADLSRTVSPLVWFQKRATVHAIAVTLAEVASHKAEGGTHTGSPAPSFATLPSTGEWAEVRIAVPQLRLAGRIDLVEKRPGLVIIRDLKSGRVEDRDGQVLPHIDLQLRLYGVMALELDPQSVVELVVDAGREYSVDFDSDVAAATREWVTDLVSRLPPGAERAASELARPGEQCSFCPYRHVCDTYLDAAPRLWRKGSASRLPLDTWGAVEAIHPRSGGLLDVTLRDDAGRRVKVFGVQAFRVDSAREGELLFFFGLRARAERDRDGAWRHPVNFYEISEDDPRDRAWSLEVYKA